MEVMARPVPQARVDVADPSAIGEARRVAARLSEAANLDEVRAGRVAIIATELATNLLRHARGGEMLMQRLHDRYGDAVELLALDRGPGLDVDRCLRDGYSTGGTSGSGLGAVRRLADAFDIDSHADIGTAVLARVRARPMPAGAPARGLVFGAVCLPIAGETACGDAWRFAAHGDDGGALVVDGLGHGPFAAEAAREATEAFDAAPFDAPAKFLARAHQRMNGTRGGAVAAARIDRARGTLTFAGVGNIGASLHGDGGSRGLASNNGTVGAVAPRIKEFSFPWSASAVLVMHSDGLGSRWRLDAYPGLRRRHPAIVAGVLYRDFGRGRDDVSVLVAREAVA